MAGQSPERLRNYLEMITKKVGGLIGQIDRLAAGEVKTALKTAGMEGLEVAGAADPPAKLAREGIETMARGQPPSRAQIVGMEAIINEDLRPAIDVVDGRFNVTHPLWTKLSNDPTLRTRIEAVLPSIGRIELPGHPNLPYGGTGFVVGNGLIMTNRHVAEIFAQGLGDRKLIFAQGRKAGIDFLREHGRPTGPTLIVERIVMIHPFWDMAILAVDGLPDGKKPLRLSLADARELTGREIFIVGYPAFDPRNPADIQQDLFEGRFGVKKLQPGELQGGMKTASFGKIVPAATHDCSTLGGNSGSAVIDLSNGEVLALHFGGLFHEQNFCVPSFALSRDTRVVDAGVQFAGSPAGDPNDWLDFWSRADSVEAAADEDEDDAGNAAATTVSSVVIAQSAGVVSVEVPLRITISLGPPTAATTVTATTPVQSGRESIAADITEAMREPIHDTDYSSRKGYDPLFLNTPSLSPVTVPMPDAADRAILAKTDAGGDVLDYQNFSIKMHAKRRLALIVASNVTKEPKLRKPDPNESYTRKALTGLGKNDQERWFIDPRLNTKFQISDEFFTKDRGSFDKGHIARRDDVAFGTTYAILRRANGDSYHVTNCSPQVAGFNRSAGGKDNWGDLENHVLSEAANERLCVFAGPVLDPGDKTFVAVGVGGVQLPATIPSRFWKAIIVRVDDGIAAYGFVLEQDLSGVDFEFAVPAAFVPAMYPLADIEAMTGIVFDASVRAADQYDTVRGGEVAMRASTRRKRRKH